jgi:dTDP-4-amino-4,6-dideoxygalactose transaminase
MGKRVTSKTKAILVGYLWGYPIDIIRLKKFAKKHSLKIIEDAAQAHGSKFEDRSLGTIGDIGCFSTFESKMIATGEGGFILTDKKEFYEKIRFFIAHCRDYEIKEGIPKIDYREVGWNYRISELTAAIGDVQIGKIDRRIKIRKSNFNYLVQGISKLNNIKPYKPDYVSFDRLNYYSALFLIDERLDGVKVASKLYELGIPTDLTCYNYRVCYDHTLFKKDSKYKKYRCENAESLTRRLINLPTYENLEKNDLDYMLRCIDKEVG